MVQVTGGKVTFSRTVQKTQYEPCRAEVTIDFIVPEGTEFTDQLDQAASYAQAKALEMVNGAPVKAAGAPAGHGAAAQTTAGSKEQYAANAPAASPARVEKAAKQAAKAPPKASVPATGQKISTGEDRTPDPAGDDWDAAPAEAPAVISDKDVLAAINKRAGELVKTVKDAANPMIRKLIADFAGPVPKRYSDIPQEKRQEFLDALVALK